MVNNAGIEGLTVDGDLSRLLPFFITFISKELN
jgi:hypothetical protein